MPDTQAGSSDHARGRLGGEDHRYKASLRTHREFRASQSSLGRLGQN